MYSTYTVKRSPWLLNTCCRCAYLLGGVDPYVTVSSELIAACIDPPPPNTPASDLSGVDQCTPSLDLNVLQLSHSWLTTNCAFRTTC